MSIHSLDSDTWNSQPAPTGFSEREEIDWLIPAAGSHGGDVFVGGFAAVHHISIDRRWLVTDHGSPHADRHRSVAIMGRSWPTASLSIDIKSLEKYSAAAELHIEPHADELSVAAFDDGATVSLFIVG